MYPTICPTITADTAEEYKRQMELVEPFASRIHVDVSDGYFAPHKLLGFDSIWWRGNRTIDLHIMYNRPAEHTEIILALRPRLVIIHAESEGDFERFAALLHKEGIEVGVALLPKTPAAMILPALEIIEHVLIFSGNLGYQGGSEADLELLKKAYQIRKAKPTVEIGWDGGVNPDNAKALVEGGIDVLNVGGYIQHAHDKAKAYATLEAAIAV